MPASPLFAFKGGPPGVKASVSAGSTVTAKLDDTSGVDQVEWAIVTTDETSASGSYVLTPSGPRGSIVTFSALGPGTAGILQARINGGLDKATGLPSPGTTTARAKFFVPTSEGREVICAAETTESDPTFGYTGLVNQVIRGLPAGGVGTGRLTCLASVAQATNDLDKAQAVSGIYYDSAFRPASKAVRWRGIALTNNPANPAHLALYDVTGATTGGTPGYVPGSVLSTSSLLPALCEADLTAPFSAITSGVFLVHLYLDYVEEGDEAIAAWAALDIL